MTMVANEDLAIAIKRVFTCRRFTLFPGLLLVSIQLSCGEEPLGPQTADDSGGLASGSDRSGCEGIV